jgi:cytochrome P450
LPGLGQVLISGDPEILQQVMSHPDLVGGKAHRALRAALGENHLIVMSGPEHRQRSKLVRQALTAFISPPEIARLTHEEFSRVPLAQPFSLHQVAQRASLRIILSGLLGLDEHPDIVQQAHQFQASFSQPWLLFVPALQRDWGPSSPWGRLLRRRQKLTQTLLQALDRAPHSSIAARLRTELAGPDLGTELLALLMFGHETTAATLAWCFSQLQAESVGRIRAGDLAYTRAFVEESLRLYPAVAQLTRVAEADLSLGPWSVARGSVVMPAISLVQQNFEQPELFRPDRFLQSDPPLRRYCPFGFGDRICPGKALATSQLVVMLQTLLQNFEIRLLAQYCPRPQRKLFLVVPHRGTPAVRWT